MVVLFMRSFVFGYTRPYSRLIPISVVSDHTQWTLRQHVVSDMESGLVVYTSDRQSTIASASTPNFMLN